MTETLRTNIGEFPLEELTLGVGARTWRILHTAAVLSFSDEQAYLREQRERLPYGVVLWPAAIALAHELASRGTELGGSRILELGAGTGLPGIVAASHGAIVTQTDRHELALSICRRNGMLNEISGIHHRIADWAAWDVTEQYDVIIGSDILYVEPMHEHLVHIFARNLAPRGRVLLSDPFRRPSLALLERLERAGWGIALSKWTVGESDDPRGIGVYECRPPEQRGLPEKAAPSG